MVKIRYLVLQVKIKFIPLHSQSSNGTLADRLGNGLQNRVEQFDSARYLKEFWNNFCFRTFFIPPATHLQHPRHCRQTVWKTLQFITFSEHQVLAIQHIRFGVNRISRKFPLAWGTKPHIRGLCSPRQGGIYGWTYYYLFRSQKAFSFSLFISFWG